MLDNETKRRIDTARDVLVGKVPDPKSQVEQITIALIYKFMDDMDQEAVEMGGKRSFFTGEYEKYAWSNIFNPRLGGFEMLALYADAITTMSLNPNLPQLFRDIFKNAFLPYRDPETLKLFLKTINEFTYDHSERLGDAFEYLLSVLGSQGDAGQFRTPRHIIDFMVQVIKPQKNESILDPACGTAGFLVSAYKYILEHNKKNLPGDLLSPEDRTRLLTNFKGYDISPDMVRLSRVNLYLHGFVQPQIYEYDTLTSEERWNDHADVILANPPFMSPKGGIKPHKRFSVQSNRSEVLFVDYMAEHLTPPGRAAIIVPEGIIFQSANAYKQLRKYLIEKNFLWAVVSLPAGVFNPYASVKTFILLLDKTLAKKTDKILFVKIEKDGYDLGAQRRRLCTDIEKPELCPEHSDLPDALNVLAAWQQALLDSLAAAFDLSNQPCSALLVDAAKLAENDDYNLNADRYREVARPGKQKWPMVTLGDVCEINPKKAEINGLPDETIVSFLPMEDLSEHEMLFTAKKERTKGEVYKGYTYFRENDVLLARVTPCFENGKSGVARNLKNGVGFGSSEYFVLRASEQILPEYIYQLISQPKFLELGQSRMTGTGGLQRVPVDYVANYQIPLPPLDVQRQIVDEIAAYLQLISGARQVVEGWKPNLTLELAESLPAGVDEWEMAKLEKVCEINPETAIPLELFGDSKFIYVDISSVENGTGHINYGNLLSTKDAPSRARRVIKNNDVLLSTVRPNLKAFAFISNPPDKAIASTGFAVLRATDRVLAQYLYIAVSDDNAVAQMVQQMGKGAYPSINQSDVENIKIPLPPLNVQRDIVARIESERRIVESNRELARIYEEKIKKVIARVWEA